MSRLALLSAVAILTLSPDIHAQPAARDNKALARRYFDVLNKGDLDAIDAIVAPDVVFRNPPVVVQGIDAFRKLVASLRAAFPDLQFTLEDEFGEGSKVATRWVMRGTQGTRKMDVSGMDIFLIANGKIKEIWVNMDTLAQARQLGMVPGP
jgi:steroid delta-isomerase-like uncharacterized protein